MFRAAARAADPENNRHHSNRSWQNPHQDNPTAGQTVYPRPHPHVAPAPPFRPQVRRDHLKVIVDQ